MVGRGGRRGLVLAAIAAAGLWAGLELGLDPRDLVPSEGGLAMAREMFSRALTPALDYEADDVPETIVPLPLKALEAARITVIFAAAAISLSLAFGLPLGFLASTAWWVGDPAGGRGGASRLLRRAGPPLVYGGTRLLITLMRSVHELLWAVLFLAAFGLSQLSAVIAIAIPFTGTLAKVFAEMIDEAPRDSALALRAAGARPAQVFLFGLLPRALPDITAYAFYRFECALRSSAVLGFFGYPTLGYFIAASFENLHYGEVWTYLYTLFLLVALADWWSGALRRKLVAAAPRTRAARRPTAKLARHAEEADEDAEIRRLHRARPRSRFARWSGVALAALVILAWSSSELAPRDFLSPQRRANLERFLGELRPYPLQVRQARVQQGLVQQGLVQDQGVPQPDGSARSDLSIAVSWAGELLSSRGWTAIGVTLAMSVAAIVLAALGTLALAPAAARTLSSPEPYLPGPRSPGWARRAFWWLLVTVTRTILIFIRSIPEYVWAFMFLTIFGPTAWPVVLALALHNAGILGKLTAEVVENLDPAPLAALRGLGASRSQIVAAGIFPLTLPRFLLFFFYRWETCVREATVLGMLGIVSLGYWIVDARARNHYDEMVFFVLLGAGLVLVGDLVSTVAREVLRRAA